MKPTIKVKLDEVFAKTMKDSREWYDTIFNYLKDGTFPKPTTKNI